MHRRYGAFHMQSNFNEKWETIREDVLFAVSRVVEHDKALLEHGLFEPCLSHRLGMYLQEKFPNYHVDCEYDRMLTKDQEGVAHWDLKGLDKSRLEKDMLRLANALDQPASRKIDIFVGRRKPIRYYFEKAIEQLRVLKSPQKFARPDVLIHERDSHRKNLLVVEIKLGAGDKCRVPMDLAKLVEFTSQANLLYSFGLFLTFKDNPPELQCALLFIDGHGFELRTEDLCFSRLEPWYHP